MLLTLHQVSELVDNHLFAEKMVRLVAVCL